MRWTGWRYDLVALVLIVMTIYSAFESTSLWPTCIALVIVFGIREAKALIPAKTDPAADLNQKLENLANQVSRLELASGLRPKGRSE